MRNFKNTTLLLMAMATSAFAQNTFIEADDANIQYMGRIDFSNPKAPAYTYPGVSISAKFNGTSVSAEIKDYGAGSATSTNYYNVFIDNVFVKVMKVTSSTTKYTLATGLANGTHTVLITKRTESSVGKSSFKGFYIEESALLTPDALPTKKIEFIGDSWTCGYGNEYEGAGANTGFTSKNEDNYAAWGAITCRRLNTQYHCTAYSGRGMFRNNDGNKTTVIPNVYNRIFPDDASSSWNFNNYIPDVVVIHLGTNDFANEQTWATNHSTMDSADYVSKYIGFISDIRTAYGSATKIVCVNGSSISVWSGFDQYNRWNNYLSAIYDHFQGLSDNNVYKFKLVTQNAPYGEDWHPAKHEHVNMTNQIVPYLQQITGWQDCNGVASGNAYMDDCTICVGGNTGKTACTPGNTSTHEYELANKSFSVFPNPVTEVLNLSAGGSWTIFNQMGEVVLKGNGMSCEVEKLSEGIYYILSLNGKEKSTATFVKE
ncbi:MAG: GDSL-type esterase/lipase family protein [Flavobacteriales bacterium]